MNDVKADRTYQTLRVTKINEAGFTEAMKSLQIYNSDEEHSMLELANMEAANPDGDHAFMHHMYVWFVMEAPLYFIQALSLLGKQSHLMSTMTRMDNTYSHELQNIEEQAPDTITKPGMFQMYRLIMSLAYPDIKRLSTKNNSNANWTKLSEQLHAQLAYPEFVNPKEAVDAS